VLSSVYIVKWVYVNNEAKVTTSEYNSKEQRKENSKLTCLRRPLHRCLEPITLDDEGEDQTKVKGPITVLELRPNEKIGGLLSINNYNYNETREMLCVLIYKISSTLPFC